MSSLPLLFKALNEYVEKEKSGEVVVSKQFQHILDTYKDPKVQEEIRALKHLYDSVINHMVLIQKTKNKLRNVNSGDITEVKYELNKIYSRDLESFRKGATLLFETSLKRGKK